MINFDWVIADPHAFHKNICRGVSTWKDKSPCRDFDDEIIMTETLANNINSVVMPEQKLLCIGDWAFGHRDNIQKFRDMINCNHIALVYGNHDKTIAKDIQYQKLFIFTERLATVKIGGVVAEICHFAMRVWDHSHHGRIHLYGHSHGTIEDLQNSLSMDVGVDTVYESIPEHKKFFPYNIKEILKHMSTKLFEPVDHHTESTT